MKTPENKRLQTVRELERLNFSKNKELNELVTLAAEICQVPIAMITLMGENMQWIKCSIGTDVKRNARENTFCKYLVSKSDVMVVEDTLMDNRFANNSIVKGKWGVRFYAGAPLVSSEGHHLGSLCVFDKTPRVFSEKQQQMLAILSNQAAHLMELELTLLLNAKYITDIKTQTDKTENSERKLRAFFNSSTSCHILIGKSFEILDFNKEAVNIIKTLHHKQLKTNQKITDYVSREFTSDFHNSFKAALAGKRTSKEILVNYGKKGNIWWKIAFRPVNDEMGNIVSVAYSAANINERKEQIAAITDRNNSLLNIAYIQSHEYRKPVASILGLMEVIKADNYYADKECLKRMSDAVKELDEKIKSVVNCTEKILAKNSA